MRSKTKIFSILLLLVLGLSLIPFSFIPKVSAVDIYWNNGFEEGDFSEWDSAGSAWSINSDIVHTGEYSAKFDWGSSSLSYLIKKFDGGGSNNSKLMFYAYFEELNFENNKLDYFAMMYNYASGMGVYPVRLEVQELDPYKWWVNGMTWLAGWQNWGVGSGKIVYEENWYNVTMTINSTIGGEDVKVWIDGDLICNGPTVGGTLKLIDAFAIGGRITGGVRAVLYVDDFLFIADNGTPVWNEDVMIDNYEYVVDTPWAERWIFAEWKYYDFSASYGYWNASGDAGDYIETAWVMLTDGWNWFNVSYNPENDSMTLESDNPDVVSLDYGSVSEAGLYLNVTFRLLFYGGTIDAMDIDLYMYVEDLDGAYDGPEIMQEDYVNIYVQGGSYATTLNSGTGGHIPGGAWNDLYANEDSIITSVVYYRNLQHFRMLNSIYIANVTGPDFELQYYIEACTEDGWVNLITLILEGEGGHTGTFRYINFTALFYESGVLDTDATKQVYFFHRAKVGAGDGDPTQTEVWIDGWIDRDNRSTVVGLRANAYYYPMKDNAEVFFRWLSTNWGVDADKRKDVSARYPMYDTDPEELISSKEIIMVRLRYVLAVSYADGGAQTVETTNYQSADYTFSPLNAEMEGIQTPPMMETLVPAMPAGGWMGALMGAFRWLGDVLIPGLGGLSIWNQMVDFLDSIAARFNAPNLFRNIITWFGSFWTWLVQSLGYLLESLVSVFTFLTVIMGSVLANFVGIMAVWIEMASWFVSVLGTGLGTGIDIWNDFNIPQWIVLAAILYPMWLIFMWDEEGIEPVYRHLNFVKGILEFGFHFFITIAQFGINLIGRVIESIPVVE